MLNEVYSKSLNQVCAIKSNVKVYLKKRVVFFVLFCFFFLPSDLYYVIISSSITGFFWRINFFLMTPETFFFYDGYGQSVLQHYLVCFRSVWILMVWLWMNSRVTISSTRNRLQGRRWLCVHQRSGTSSPGRVARGRTPSSSASSLLWVPSLLPMTLSKT